MKLKQLFVSVITFSLFLVAAKAVSAQSYINLTAMPGTGVGTVLLTWTKSSVADTYNIAYGTQPGVYTYGATNVGWTTNYQVGGLAPGQRYYFVVSPVVAGQGQAYSNEASSLAATSGTVSTSTTAQTAKNQAGATSITSGPSNAPWYMTAVSGPSRGQVTLKWKNDGSANNFSVAYGTKSEGNLVYGALNVGNVLQYTISGLTPGKAYIFSLLPQMDTTPGTWTNPVAARAMQ